MERVYKYIINYTDNRVIIATCNIIWGNVKTSMGCFAWTKTCVEVFQAPQSGRAVAEHAGGITEYITIGLEMPS